MNTAEEKKNPPVLADHLGLIAMTLETVKDPARAFASVQYDCGEEAQRLNFIATDSGAKNACIVTADKTALELGSPKHQSVSFLLWTKAECHLGGRIWTAGTDFRDIRQGPVSFVMIAMVRIAEDFDPTGPRFHSILNLSNKIPGYMSRSIPGKLWVRIGKDLMGKNFSLNSLGQCLVHAIYESVPGLLAVDVVLAADDPELAGAFESIGNRARVISGENKKLALEADGTLSCEDLNCASCEEKPHCDTIRDIIVKRSERAR
jgi:hypothetical protein